MRARVALAALAAFTALAASPALAAGPPSGMDAALAAGDWRRAAGLGASAADVVRALQAKGRFIDATPSESVVTIDTDNGVEVAALKPLPAVEGASPDARTVGLSGSGFAFNARPGAIILYPDDARSFATQGRRFAPTHANGAR